MPSRADVTRQWTASQPVVAAFLASLIPDFHDAQDVLQEVAVAVLESFADYDAQRPFVAWAIGIARHKVLDFRRRSAVGRVAFDSETIDGIADAYVTLRDRFNPVSEALEHCLKRVTGKASELLKMRYQFELKSAEIAERIGGKPSAVDMALHRIRLALRQCIERRLGRRGAAT